MAQESVTQDTAYTTHEHGDEHQSGKHLLGPLLCWGVVFADIGTSVYYTPGLLYQSVQGLAGFFVFLTMIVFILLTLKYAEVTYRYPQGGGVVTVAAQALNPWFGALGGMFIVVDYFLTAAISCLSGIHYLSVLIPPLGPYAELVTVITIALLGLLNWFGISESAKVSFVGGAIAFFSNIAIVITVFVNIPFSQFLSLFPQMFANNALTPYSLLTGFAGAFLAFSGLESISQLSPVMKQPRKKVASIALALVVISIALTSPLLTLFATTLLPGPLQVESQREQIVSILAGNWGNKLLEIEVAISASALLVFAANTAVIGCYHVFMALTRMDFLPSFMLKRNKLRGTPHYAILVSTLAPILVIILVGGQTKILGDMYAFGLLGAFTLTCISLDIVRFRDFRKGQAIARAQQAAVSSEETQTASDVHDLMRSNVQPPTQQESHEAEENKCEVNTVAETRKPWFKIDFVLGVLTTILVSLAWSVNLVTKPEATLFGGTVTLLGMGIAYYIHARHQKEGKVPVPVVVTRLEGHFPGSILAILTENNPHNDAVIRAAVNNASAKHPVLFLYLAEKKPRTTAPRMLEIIDPYLEDQQAKESFGKAEALALKAKIPTRKYVYLQEKPDIVSQIWQSLHPSDTLIAVENDDQFKNINPDRIRYELTPEGKVAHLLKRW